MTNRFSIGRSTVTGGWLCAAAVLHALVTTARQDPPHRSAEEQPVASDMKVRSLEIVDERGVVAAKLSAAGASAMLEFFSMGAVPEGTSRTTLGIGCNEFGMPQLFMRDPNSASRAEVQMYGFPLYLGGAYTDSDGVQRVQFTWRSGGAEPSLKVNRESR